MKTSNMNADAKLKGESECRPSDSELEEGKERWRNEINIM